MTATQYKQMWDRFQRRYEGIYTTAIKKVLRQQLEEFFATGSMNADGMRRVLIDLYNTCGVQWAAKTGVHRRKPISIKARLPMGFSERIVRLMREYYGDTFFLNLAEEITDTSRIEIIRILNEAAITGIGINDIVKQFPAEFGEKRARMIARTETVASSNNAALLNAKDTDVPMQKIWMSVVDKRTRRSHLNANKTTVGLDDYFTVGGVRIAAPGAKVTDEGLPTPGETVIQCRCVMGFRVINTKN